MAGTYARRVDSGRLKYFGRKADADFWTEQWTAERARSYYARAETGALGLFEDFFTSYLPREGRILEAGCGLGQLVVALRKRGYDCEGVEWSRTAVERALDHDPDLPVRVGDVTDLDVPDHTYHGLISIGVIEHREEGPRPFLVEARRILRPDGVMLVSVPWFNRLRRMKARLGLYHEEVAHLPFYQQAFTTPDLSAELQNSGFEVLAQTSYHAALGITSEVAGAGALFRMPLLGRLPRVLNRSPRVNQLVAHMLMLVCRPRVSGSQ